MDAQSGLSVTVLMLAGGLLDGDEMLIDVRVESGARLAVRTQAATQVHRGRSRQTLRAEVLEEGCFSYLPRALVPHAGADHGSLTQVSLQPTSRVLLAEILSPGRVASGEVFAYTRVGLHLDVRCGAILLARERSTTRPDAQLRAAQFGSFSHVASVYSFGLSPPPRLQAFGRMRAEWTELAQRDGWYARALAHRAADLERGLAQLHAEWWTAVQAGR
jgi:urease accessory protein